MKTTTVTCDRCGKTESAQGAIFPDHGVVAVNSVQFWQVTVGVHGAPSYSRTTREAEWCRDCVVAAGLLEPSKKEPPEELPTIEEVIREIVQEELNRD